MITYTPLAGTTIHQACREAIQMQRENGVPVQFEFNGIILTANADSTADKVCEEYWRMSRVRQDEEKAKENEREYMKKIGRLEQVRKNLPTVDQAFMLEVASMPIEELQRRILVQADWHGHFSHAFDGLDLKRSGFNHTIVEGCLQPDDARMIVSSLIDKCADQIKEIKALRLSSAEPATPRLPEPAGTGGNLGHAPAAAPAEPGTAAPTAEA